MWLLLLVFPIVFSLNTNKICRDCKHFIGSDNTCKKFGKTDLITGIESFEMASYVRYNENKCGIKGSFFEENNFKIITVPYYFFLNNWIYLIVIFPLLLGYGYNNNLFNYFLYEN